MPARAVANLSWVDDRSERSGRRGVASSLALVIVLQLVIGGFTLVHRDGRSITLARAAPATGAVLTSAQQAGPSPAAVSTEVAGQVILDGQSLVNFPREGRSTVAWAAAMLAPTSAISLAIDGSTYAERAATFDERLAPLLAGGRTVLADIGGQSDLLWGMRAPSVYDEMVTYHRRARSAGAVMTIVSTVPPIGLDWLLSPAIEQERQRLNEMLRVSEEFDVVVDLAALPAAADPLDPRFYADQIHPTELLAQQFAHLLVTTLRQARLGVGELSNAG